MWRLALFLFAVLTTAAQAAVVYAPAVDQPSVAGDVVGIILQNTAGTTEAAGYVTFGQVFKKGDVATTDSMVAKYGATTTYLQMDVKATHDDGSVRHAILTFLAPSIAGNASTQVMIAKGTASAPGTTAPSKSALVSGGYDATTTLTFLTPNTNIATASAATVLGGTTTDWLSGPLVNEWRGTTTLNGDLIKITFDVRAYADGTTVTDVIHDNCWFQSGGKSDLNYDVDIGLGGVSAYTYQNVYQYIYSRWHYEVDSTGIVKPNIQFDVPYLRETGVIENWNMTKGVNDTLISDLFTGLTSPDKPAYGNTNTATAWSIAPETATFTGSITGNVLTAGTVTGTIYPGSILSSGGRVISNQITGTPGAAGTYYVTGTANLSSTSLTASYGLLTLTTVTDPSHPFVKGTVLTSASPGLTAGTAIISDPITGDGGTSGSTIAVNFSQTADNTGQGTLTANNRQTRSGPMGTREVTVAITASGPRQDIGPQPGWVIAWVMSQSAVAYQTIMANADVAGVIPWHMTDEDTGEPIKHTTYPKFFQDPRNTGSDASYTPTPANGWPTTGGYSPNDPWTTAFDHHPDLPFIPYVISGRHFYLDEVKHEADWCINAQNPWTNWAEFTGSNYIDPSSPGSNHYVGVFSDVTRAQAWKLRQVNEAAFILPDSDALKSYFVDETNNSLAGVIYYYITSDAQAGYGDLRGFVGGNNVSVFNCCPNPTGGQISVTAGSPWHQGYLEIILGSVSAKGMNLASARADQLLVYTTNWEAGLLTNGANGFNPWNGPAYFLFMNNVLTLAPINNWADFQTLNLLYHDYNNNGWGLISADTDLTQFDGSDLGGGYPAIMRAGLAVIISRTDLPQAQAAYDFLVSGIDAYWAAHPGLGTQLNAWQNNVTWSIDPTTSAPSGTVVPMPVSLSPSLH